MKIKARIDIIELKEEPVLTTEVEVSSIEAEVARLTSHLNPKRKYRIVVKPELPGLDPEKCGCIFDGSIFKESPFYKDLMDLCDEVLPDILKPGIMGPLEDGNYMPIRARMTLGPISKKTRRENR